MSGIFGWTYEFVRIYIFGGVPEISSAQEVNMPDQKQSPKSTRETEKNGGPKSNVKNQTKRVNRKNSNANKTNCKKPESKPSPKPNSKPKQSIKTPIPVESKTIEDFNYIDQKDLQTIFLISLEVLSKVKNFWGPFVDLEPLKLKSEKLISTLKNKFPESESARKYVCDLEEGLQLLEDRSPMIESRGGETSDSDGEDKIPSVAYTQVCQVGMRVFRLNKQLKIGEPHTKGHIKVLTQQFIKCQTDLDQLKINKKDKNAIESKRDVLIFCNDVLTELNRRKELNL